ncbi:MAG: hypothetical protein ABFD79_05345 [Phycisphaerales bacterium]
MKLEMTAETGDTVVLISEKHIELEQHGNNVSLCHEEIKTLTTLLERYKSALKEAHGG